MTLISRMMCSVAAITFAAAISATPSRADPAAEFYSGKTVVILIGSSMGGSYGFYAQPAARHIPKFLPGSPNIIVQAKTGASGNVALNYMYAAGPQDGTMVSVPSLGLVQETLFNPDVRYNAKDFKYIGRFTDILGVATATAASGIKSIDDLRRRQYAIGTAGTRNMTFIGPAAMNRIAGTKLKIISGYRGTGESYKALEQGEVDMAITSWTTLRVKHAEDLKSGKFLPIFNVASKRLEDLPNIPVVTEFGDTDAEKAFLKIITIANEIGRSVAGPPGMPRHLVDAWRAAFDKVVADPAFRKDITERNVRLNVLSGEALEEIVHETMDLPAATINSAHGIYKEVHGGSK